MFELYKLLGPHYVSGPVISDSTKALGVDYFAQMFRNLYRSIFINYLGIEDILKLRSP